MNQQLSWLRLAVHGGRPTPLASLSTAIQISPPLIVSTAALEGVSQNDFRQAGRFLAVVRQALLLGREHKSALPAETVAGVERVQRTSRLVAGGDADAQVRSVI